MVTRHNHWRLPYQENLKGKICYSKMHLLGYKFDLNIISFPKVRVQVPFQESVLFLNWNQTVLNLFKYLTETHSNCFRWKWRVCPGNRPSQTSPWVSSATGHSVGKPLKVAAVATRAFSIVWTWFSVGRKKINRKQFVTEKSLTPLVTSALWRL